MMDKHETSLFPACRKPVLWLIVCALSVLAPVMLSAVQEVQWTPALIRQLYAADRAKAEAENLVQRAVVEEITLPNRWKVTLWSVSFPTSTPLSSRDLSKAYFHEEVTMTDMSANGQAQLVYAGDDERSNEFSSKFEGFKTLSDARSSTDGTELLLSAEFGDMVLMRLKMNDGVWEYDSHAPIFNTATASHTAINRKLIGDGKIQVEWSGQNKGSVFEISRDGVVKENGVLYRPKYTKYDETHGLEEGYRQSFQIRRQAIRERLAAQGILKTAALPAAIHAGGPASADLSAPQSSDAKKRQASFKDAAANMSEEHGRDDSQLLALVGITALLTAAMLVLRHLKKRGA